MTRKSLIFWVIFVPDVLLLYASLWISIRLRYPEGISQPFIIAHLKAFSVLFALWLLVFFIHGLFEFSTLRRYASLFFNLVSAMIVNLLVAILYFYFQPNLILTPRRFLLLELGVAFGLLLIWYLIVKYVIKNKLTEGLYLFSFNEELKELEQEIIQHWYAGYRVLGHLNAESLKGAEFAKNVGMVLPNELGNNPEVIKEFYKLRTNGMQFYNFQDFYENLLRRIYLSRINEVWFLENINYREKRLYNILKRLVDIVAGFVFFIVFLVSYPIIALAIKLDTEGPALFSQKRVGKNGSVFSIYKYRSMVTATDTTWTQVNDKRITKVGKFLRKTRIDELPQSINVLRGDLSLVGPRPEQPNIVEQLREQIPFYDERHLVKPGITGWAQLNIYAGSLEETKLKLQFDLYYIKHRSFFFDLEIILKTIYYIFTWQGR